MHKYKPNIEKEIDYVLNILKSQNFQFHGRKPEHSDGNDFYRIISKHLWKDPTHPKAARKLICNFQVECEIVYWAFQPKSEENGCSLKKFFENDLKTSRQNKNKPTPRDVTAAANVLQMPIIHFIFSDGEVLFTDKFVPKNKNETDNPVFVLLLEKSGTYIELTVDAGVDTSHYQVEGYHDDCYWKRHRRTFELRRTFFYGDSSAIRASKYKIPDEWEEIATKYDDCSFFRCVSWAVYGNEDLHGYVFELMKELQQNKLLASAFADLGDQENDTKASTEETEKHLKKEAKKMKKKYGEIQAVATLLQTDIYIANRSVSGQIEWEVIPALPVTLKMNLILSKSYITLMCYRDVFSLLIPKYYTCSCELTPPEVHGCISRFKRLNFASFANEITAQLQVCCTDRRYKPHIHLQEFGISKPRRVDPTDPGIRDVLRQEARTLTGRRQGFHQCIYKNATDGADSIAVSENDIANKSEELKVPIFILQQNCIWKKYYPTTFRNAKCGNGQLCRYYITLLQEGNYYTEIIPQKGCNCQKMSPENTNGPQNSTPSIVPLCPRRQLHSSIIKHLLEISTMSCDDVRNPYLYKECDEVQQLYQRPDFVDKQLEAHEVGSSGDYFFGCISKNIYGIAANDVNIRDNVVKEMLDNPSIYSPKLDTESTGTEDMLKTHVEALQKHFPIEDVDIDATATFLQIPIYVLKLNTDGSSHWKKYETVRKKRFPNSDPERENTSQSNYHVTLLLHPDGKYYRVVPRQNLCNCRLQEPLDLEVVRAGIWEPMSTSEKEICMAYRNLRKALSRTELTAKVWIDLCDEIIPLAEQIVQVLTDHRRKVNIATIFGSSAGIVGGALAIAGVALAPLTFGASLGLTIAGSVVGVSGGVAVVGSKVAEAVIVKQTLKDFVTLGGLLDTVSGKLQKDVTECAEAWKHVEMLTNNYTSEITTNGTSIAPSVLRNLFGLHFIPVLALGISFRTVSMALGAIFGAATVAIDAALIATAGHNLYKGSKTSVTEELEKKINDINIAKARLITWQNGNADKLQSM